MKHLLGEKQRYNWLKMVSVGIIPVEKALYIRHSNVLIIAEV